MLRLDDSLSDDELLMQGKISCMKGFYNDAIAEFTSLIEKNKTAQALYYRGYAYFRSVDRDIPLPNSGNKETYIAGIENAINDFEEALKIEPNHKSAKENLDFMKQQMRKVMLNNA